MPSLALATGGAGTRARKRSLMRLFLDVPTRPADLAQRHWNAFAKEAMRQSLLNHHRHMTPRHFEASAAARYGYAARNAKYNAYKERKYKRAALALIKTGRTKDVFTSAAGYEKLTIGGAAEGGKKSLMGTLQYRFPFRGGTGKKRKDAQARRIEIGQLIREVQSMTPDELADAAITFRQALWSRVEQFRGERKRVRLPKN